MITFFDDFLYENIQKQDYLIIVDVQEEFCEYIPNGMIKNIFDYCVNFNTVYQIWDNNDNQINPSYIFPNEKNNIVKKFGTRFSTELEDTVKYLNDKYPTANEGDLFDFDDINSFVVKVNNNHGWFYIPEKMANVFNELKNKNVRLIGGAYNECIKDVYIAMCAFKINVDYDKRYIYSAKTSKTQTYNKNTQENLI